jgi:uncharacterized protein
MKHQNTSFSRRRFLKTALAAPVGAALTTNLADAAGPDLKNADTTKPVPTRKLGRNGPPVCMIALGCQSPGHSVGFLDIAWSMGLRYFDTADCYLNGKSETVIRDWLAKYPERRSELFLVSKDHPHQGPGQLLELIDKRLEALGTKYLDLFFIHALGPKEYGEQSPDWLKSDALKKVAEQLKNSGKCKMVGFSSHDARVSEYLMSAAQGGFLDAIMMQYNPFFTKGDAFDQGLDACHKAGIGLVAMKVMRNAADIPKRLPEFDKLGLTTQQALLQATWSDPRISAVCTRICNTGEMDTDIRAAQNFSKPLSVAQINLLREVVVAHRRTMCTGCPACDAFASASGFALRDIARFVTYYEQDGNLDARNLYQALPLPARDPSGINLAALRDACSFKTDYPDIISRAHRYFT